MGPNERPPVHVADDDNHPEDDMSEHEGEEEELDRAQILEKNIKKSGLKMIQVPKLHFKPH